MNNCDEKSQLSLFLLAKLSTSVFSFPEQLRRAHPVSLRQEELSVSLFSDRDPCIGKREAEDDEASVQYYFRPFSSSRLSSSVSFLPATCHFYFLFFLGSRYYCDIFT